jgi:hypothetical protein
MGERAAVAVEERRQVLGVGEAHERVPRVGQRHVERVDLPRLTGRGQQGALVAPVDPGLGAGDGLEAAVQRRRPPS